MRPQARRAAEADLAEARMGLAGAYVAEPKQADKKMDLGRGLQAVAAGGEVGELFRYDIAMPVTLPRRQSAMLPIVNQEVKGQKVSIYNPSVHAKHPLNGLRMTNSTKLVAPFHGGERMLGTNPIAIAFPGLEEPPIVIDFATSATAYGKIEIAKRRGSKIPSGWAVDASGTPTEQPDGMIQGGALLPLGSFAELSGHKGFCLAAMVDVLCCVLSGANWGPFAPPFALRQEIPARSVGQGIGHFFGALRIEAFIDETEFKRQIDDWIRTFRATRPMPGTEGVRIPGDPEREAEADRSVNGIPLIEPVIRDLEEIGRIIGAKFGT
ncbi:MAG: Ldh family oxidoreductase [Pirellulales bacterium]|nr:Ldh family oxidoreductase [Pirellulales bacterium]